MNSNRPPFRPPDWLRGAHAQTLAAFLAGGPRDLAWRAERMELPDGDFVDAAHLGAGDGPSVCIFHGLEGCIRSHYVGGLAQSLSGRGFRVAFMHWRGCSGEANRKPRAYHSGETGDIAWFIETIQRRRPDAPVAAVGISLGGNALLKYLGEQGADAPLSAAAAVSVPFDLSRSADYIHQGFSRLYERYLLRRLKRSTRARVRRLGRLPIDLEAMQRARGLREFDQAVTAPLHGFASAEDYYRRSSCGGFLSTIRVPTLIIHARDDPFVDPRSIPAPGDVSDNVELEVTAHGGHVGFLEAAGGLRARRWLDARIPAWLWQKVAPGDAR